MSYLSVFVLIFGVTFGFAKIVGESNEHAFQRARAAVQAVFYLSVAALCFLAAYLLSHAF
jgi:hypothetical protein